MSANVHVKIQRITQDRPNALSIHLNEHWALHRTLLEAVKELAISDFPSPEERVQCLETGQLWNVIYYPRSQVGFISVYASTLEGALDYLIETLESQGYQPS